MRSYGAELLACSKGTQWKASLLILEEMSVSRVEMNSVIWSEVLSSMAKARHWRRALSLLMEVEENAPKDATIVLYNNLITAMGTHWSRALAILHRAQQRHLQPTNITLNSLIAACSQGADWAEAVNLFFDRSIAIADLVSLNTAIAACGNAGRWDAALRLFRSCASRRKILAGESFDIVTWNAIAGACAVGQQWKLVLSMGAEMTRHNLEPNILTFNTMLKSCAQAHRWPLALAVFAELQQSSCRSDIITYTTVLSALEVASHWQKAVKLYFHELALSGIETNVVASNSLLAACAAGQQWELVTQLVLAVDRLAPHDPFTYGIVSNMLQQGSQWRPMLALLQQASCHTSHLGFLRANVIAACEQAYHSLVPVVSLLGTGRRVSSSLDLRRGLPFQAANVTINAVSQRGAKKTKQVTLDEALWVVLQQSVWAGRVWDISPANLLAAASLPSAEMREAQSLLRLMKAAGQKAAAKPAC